MKGYIREVGKNWQITVDVGMTPEGKRKRHFETVRGKKGDAQRKLREILDNLDKGVYTPPSKSTVASHLKTWLAGYAKTNCSQRTYEGYRSIIETHLIPSLGDIQLRRLQPPAIQKYYGEAVTKLSHRTVHHHHRVLSESLKYAIRQGYLGRNPCELVDPPKPRKIPMRTLTPAEVEVLLERAQDNQFYPVIYTAVSTGLRQAELLGLRWRDIDLDSLSISVNRALYKRRGVCEFKEPKSNHSRRRVAMTEKLGTYLREYKVHREVLWLELGKILSLDDLVFCTIEGKPQDPGVLSHNFARIARRAGLGHVRFHDLRHTFASLMLLRGASPKVISEALGHSSVAFTLDTYSHIIEGMQSDAMSKLNDVLPTGANRNFVANSSLILE